MTSKMKSMARFTGMLGRSRSVAAQPNASSSSSALPAANYDNAPAGSPEATATHSIRLFCESGSMSNGGEEVLHLPAIVDAAESSPTAAAASAQQIRKFLTREWSSKPHVQYNAIMLIRILSDNPGPSFTRCFDKPFVSTIKEVLRNCKDGSTQQILRETLDNLEANKSLQEGLEPLITMWRKEKGSHARLSQGPNSNYFPPAQPQGAFMSGGGRSQHGSNNRSLPPPHELVSRIEEARNTAKILLQLIQSTPADEVVNNDLLREFADRCQSAQRSMQGFINSTAPPPDDDTMLTLIETNEQLSLASSRYQRAQLSARKALGMSPPPGQTQRSSATNTPGGNGPFAPPAMPPPTSSQPDNLFAQSQPPPQLPPQNFTNHSAFASPTHGGDSFQAPPGPPPQQQQPYQSQSAFASPPTTDQPPPGPPLAMLNRLNSRDTPQSPPTNYPNPTQQPSDPFADPVEHDPTTAPSVALQNPTPSQPSHPAQFSHSQAFNINAEPSYAPGTVAPPQPERPAVAPYNASGVTPSYLGRQENAVQGVTMSGGVQEIDGFSEVGRKET